MERTDLTEPTTDPTLAEPLTTDVPEIPETPEKTEEVQAVAPETSKPEIKATETTDALDITKLLPKLEPASESKERKGPFSFLKTRLGKVAAASTVALILVGGITAAAMSGKSDKPTAVATASPDPSNPTPESTASTAESPSTIVEQVAKPGNLNVGEIEAGDQTITIARPNGDTLDLVVGRNTDNPGKYAEQELAKYAAAIGFDSSEAMEIFTTARNSDASFESWYKKHVSESSVSYTAAQISGGEASVWDSADDPAVFKVKMGDDGYKHVYLESGTIFVKFWPGNDDGTPAEWQDPKSHSEIGASQITRFEIVVQDTPNDPQNPVRNIGTYIDFE